MTKDEEFKASIGWFSRFKRRCNWNSIAQSGEGASADKESMTDEGVYTNQTIFNIDPTVVFWWKITKRTFMALLSNFYGRF